MNVQGHAVIRNGEFSDHLGNYKSLLKINTPKSNGFWKKHVVNSKRLFQEAKNKKKSKKFMTDLGKY